MSELIHDARQIDLEQAIADAKNERLYGMDEARRQLDVAVTIFKEMTGKPGDQFYNLSPSERRPYIDLACRREYVK